MRKGATLSSSNVTDESDNSVDMTLGPSSDAPAFSHTRRRPWKLWRGFGRASTGANLKWRCVKYANGCFSRREEGGGSRVARKEGKGGKTEFKTEFHTQGGGNTKLTENLTTPTNEKTNKLD